MAARSLVLLGALAAVATAAGETTTVNVIMPLDNPQSLVGSIVDAGATTSKIAVACADANDEKCIVPGTQTLVVGPSTWAVNFGFSANGLDIGSFTLDAGCKLDPDKDMATCSSFISGDMGGKSMSESMSESIISGYLTHQHPVTITAGADKLAAAPAATPTGSGGSSTGSAPSGSSSTSSDSAASSPTGSRTSSRTGSTTSSTAGTTAGSSGAATLVPGQNALLAGVVALFGVAMLL